MKRKTVVFVCIILCAIFLLLVSCRDKGNSNETEQDDFKPSLAYSVAFSDGYDKSTMPFEVKYQSGSEDSQANDLTVLIRSKDELYALCQEKGYRFFNENDDNFDRKISRTIRSFDDEYFINKSLVLILLNGISCYLPQINELSIEGGTLYVCVCEPTDNPTGIDERKNTFVCIVETDGQATKNVGEVKIKTVKSGNTLEYEKINSYSDFYSLEYAYKSGMVTQNDIRSIGYYHNGGKEWAGKDPSVATKKLEDFVKTDYIPVSKNPQIISANTIDKIKKTYAEVLNSSIKFFYEKKGLSIKKDVVSKENVYEIEYYGTYNGYIAVAVKSDQASFQQVTTATIADTVFYYANSAEIVLLFRDGK